MEEVPASPSAQSWASRAPDNRPDGRRVSRRASGNVLSAARSLRELYQKSANDADLSRSFGRSDFVRAE